jgi:sigma-B regulation protein RsbU (phosphoserine phosphatase)
MIWPYRLLLILFIVTLISQTTFTIDVVRTLSGDYPLPNVALGAPWPSITSLSRAARAAGLRKGDRVIAIEGRGPRGAGNLAQAVHAKHPGERLTFTVERDGKPVDFQAPLEPFYTWWSFALISLIFMPWLSILLGFWVTAIRPRDARAWLVLGILLGMSQMMRPTVLDPRGWPFDIGPIAIAFRELASAGWPLCMMLFGIYFPQRWRVDRRVPWIKWLFIVPLAAEGIYRTAGGVAAGLDWNLGQWPDLIPGGIGTVLGMAATSVFFMALASKYPDPALAKDDRRRLKVLYWGSTIAMGPAFLLILYSWVVLHRGAGDSDALVYSMMAMALFPVTMAYVIVVGRALDVRMIVRTGVQYTLARGGIRIIQVCLTAAVLVFVVGMADKGHVSRPMQMMQIGIAVVLVVRIRSLGERVRRWVDRRFFREAYNAEQILSELSEHVRSILNTRELLETVARKISESMHVPHVAVMLQDGGMFRPALATGYTVPMDYAISASAPAIARLRQSRAPIDVTSDVTGDVTGDATGHAELAPLGAQLLLPLASGKELLGFIGLGPKKSEEPYSPSDTNLLRTVAAQTGLALEISRLSEAFAGEVAKRETLARELEIAREVQQRLFPQTLPSIPALEYAGHCRPASGVGGDYYDFLALSNGRLGLAIGDISGKGIPAALLMASLQASVRGESRAAENDIAGLMTNVNGLVFDASPSSRYATFFYAQFDPATLRMVYTNGGHNPPMLLRGGEVIRFEVGGPPVGLFRAAQYEQAEVQLAPGDLLLLYTDGMSEAENPAEEEWGEDALIAAARSCFALPSMQMITRMLALADAFAAGAPQHDDMTLVVVRVL